MRNAIAVVSENCRKATVRRCSLLEYFCVLFVRAKTADITVDQVKSAPPNGGRVCATLTIFSVTIVLIQPDLCLHVKHAHVDGIICG